MIQSKAPGKMILIGEYAVLEGAPALVCALDCFARVTIGPNKRTEHTVESLSLNLPEVPFVMSEKGHVRFDPQEDAYNLSRLKFFADIFEEVCACVQKSNKRLKPVRIKLNTDDFYSAQLQAKYGFGSSAALTVALVHALLSCTDSDSELTQEEIFKLGYIAHRKAQGNLGSGIDVAASAFGGILRYQLDQNQGLQPKPPEPLTIDDQLFMFPIWAGHSTSTRKMVAGVDELKAKNRGLYDSVMIRLIDCSAKGCASYQEKNRTNFLESIKEYNRLLLELGTGSGMPIVSEQHQSLTRILEEEGAYYKPSGAGGGDIGICFCSSPDLKVKLVKRVKAIGFQPLDFSIARHGVQAVSPKQI